jgi:hypothetical protein
VSGNYAAKANEELGKAHDAMVDRGLIEEDGDRGDSMSAILPVMTEYHLRRAQVYATLGAGQFAGRIIAS